MQSFPFGSSKILKILQTLKFNCSPAQSKLVRQLIFSLFQIVFAILLLFVAHSQQQRRARLQVIRNLNDDNNELTEVQRYEETPPIRPLRRQPAARPISPPARPALTVPLPARPATSLRAREEAAPAPKTKVERKLFTVLLRTGSGFQETGRLD